MAIFADYAPAETHAHRGPSPWLAALLTVLTPGLGHLYIGQARRGITLFVLVMIADTLLMFAMMGILARFWMCATSLMLLIGLWLYILFDAVTRARRTPPSPLQRQNRWTLYVGACVLAYIVFAGPFLYALQAKASGRLWVRLASSNMEPTLEAGEVLLADATYYNGRQPMRGEVAVYKHPTQSDIPCIKRIVAVEGDRIATRAGHAVVNGMALEEPYINAGTTGAALTDMTETQIPAGHVFVLGDNRTEVTDPCGTVAHGVIPLGNLIGRVTDVAISRHLTRMGRWIGTPSNL
jgi:signal peptidase I